MPGYVIHMAMAETIIANGLFSDRASADLFRLGSVAPDALTVGEPPVKQISHFWNKTSLQHLKRTPDLHTFLHAYGERLADPYVFGYYGHLFLDTYFVDEYWSRHFVFLNDRMEAEEGYDEVAFVKLVDTGEVFPRTDFFSDRLYYGDYDRMNATFVREYDVRVPEIPVGYIAPVREVPLDVAGDRIREMFSLVDAVSGTVGSSLVDAVSGTVGSSPGAVSDARNEVGSGITGDDMPLVFDPEDLHEMIGLVGKKLLALYPSGD